METIMLEDVKSMQIFVSVVVCIYVGFFPALVCLKEEIKAGINIVFMLIFSLLVPIVFALPAIYFFSENILFGIVVLILLAFGFYSTNPSFGRRALCDRDRDTFIRLLKGSAFFTTSNIILTIGLKTFYTVIFSAISIVAPIVLFLGVSTIIFLIKRPDRRKK